MYFGFYDNGQALIGPNTGLNIATHHLTTMMRGFPIPITPVTTDGHAVGLVYDQSLNGMTLRQPTDANKPLLGSDGTRSSYLTFDGANDSLTVTTSLSFFNTFWQTVPKGTVLIWFKMNQDGTSRCIMNNWGTLATNPGMQIIKNAANTLTARAGDGTIRWTYTSIATVLVASGWRGLIVSCNGVGASAGRFILMDSAGTILEDATFAVAAGTVINAFTDMRIGMRENDLFFHGAISALIVENFPVSDSLIEEFRNYNPERIITEFSPIAQWLLDMNNNAYIYSDVGLSVPVAHDDIVRGMRQQNIGNLNITPAHGALRRQCSAPSDAASAIYKTNVINGNAAILFDGSDDNYSFSGVPVELFEEQGGKWTCFIVARNDDTTLGSHIFSGNNYVVLTGSGYSGENPPTTVNPYCVIHPDPVGTSIHTNTKGAGVDGFKVAAFRRNGSALAAWNGDKTKTTSTSSSVFSISNMGLALTPTPGATWNMHGYLAFFQKHNGEMTDAQVEAEIDRLNARFGL